MKINNRRGTNPRNRRKIEERSMAMLSPTTPIVHWWQALVPTQYVRGVQYFIVDYRQMERNKYSPWGRGRFGGKPSAMQGVPRYAR